MNDKIITFRTYATLPEAARVKDMLEQNDVQCFLANECFAQLYPLYGTSSVGGVQLHIFEKDKQLAEEIIQTFEEK
ncbi:MAG: DUF2007 domain-containing protein [Paludibacter sp.]|nr:DUF2007 domain-containing protein [Bacteroidales bacterium]MCM1068486.1 DUF2007 domain-containing protein [Prevotella sp.]MCM1353440.1 DUF2007 domain-containing protein [Bacteroides sp.]MCM1442601.1 DUF2007 domain-containing protein [Muribaculum sp.]MCM1481446.1 DUF2007 domain-containing protein [Paludibacter sp.]